jgi:hypothetical protein
MAETRKLAAVLAADVVGYSRLTGSDEERTLCTVPFGEMSERLARARLPPSADRVQLSESSVSLQFRTLAVPTGTAVSCHKEESTSWDFNSATA